ncbi:MAG: tetratricopeptide repeat protein [Deltaproteobacteria bacterium]|nr:tetratricopeptide repeat protein [Deltaproteobacteria bacterium]
MAELFLRQGLPARAVAIYRKRVREHPEDEVAARRLAELETQNAGQSGGAMGFREPLQRIVDTTPGAIASTLMGFDGIAIDTYQVGESELDVATLLIEYAGAVQQLRRTADTMPQVGKVAQVEIQAHNLVAMMRPVTDEIFLGVVLRADAMTGKARYLMRLAVPHFVKELS